MSENNQAPAGRRRIMLASMLFCVAIVLGRAIQIQVLENGKWEVRAEKIHGDTLQLQAPRGVIYDRNGVPLAGSHDLYRVSIAPNQVRDADAVGQVLRTVGGLSPAEVARALSEKRKWVVLPGLFDSRIDGALRNTAGVYMEAISQRFYPHGPLALELLGAIGTDGRPSGGLELEMDSVLRGSGGQATVRRDSRGRVLPGAMVRTVQPVPGRDVYLTIDAGLQEIADAALTQAMDSTHAAGGEILLADPRTGEVLAAVSRKGGARAGNWRAVTESYEPGSTLKPFTVAALLSTERAALTDSVYAEEGKYEITRGRTLNDDHPRGWLTLGDAVRVSSNIAIAKVATRLYPREQYLNLRNFGFGSPAGVEYPSESGGLLRRPDRWTSQSPASLAIGYEIGVTPLQMAMAYGALANGGMLLEPHLIREVRARDGRVERSYAPRAIRRAVSEDVAAKIRDVLVDVVSDGTATAASLGTYEVAGKTGTARIAENGHYKAKAYTASFAGFFPADNPQLVFLVKLDEPQGDYYGGLTAAPVIKVALEAAIAALNTPLDRSLIATRAPELPSAATVRLASATFAPHARPATVRGPSVLTLSKGAKQPVDTTALLVPETTGLTIRDAARALHAAGFRVSVNGAGAVSSTYPAPGASLRKGAVVRVVGGGAR